MPPIKPNIGTKSDYASRPSVPSSQKENATEFNLIVSALRANYERLILRWATDVSVNEILPVGQYIVFTDEGIYRVHTAFNVGSPITWDVSKVTQIGGGSDHFKGVYADETALNTAHPTAEEGDYAFVDTGSVDAALYIWDDTDTVWVQSGITTIVPDADESTKGVVEEAAQSEANAGTATGGSGAKLFITPAKLLALAATFANQLIFGTSPIVTPLTASKFLRSGSSKEIVSVDPATQAEMVTGTEDGKPATPKSVEDKGSVKLRTISNSATGTTDIDCLNQDTVHVVFTNTVTGAITLTVSQASNLQVLNVTIPITGANIGITTPSTTRMPTYLEVSAGDGWYQSTKILQVSSINTADTHELSFKRASTGPTFNLAYDGPYRA